MAGETGWWAIDLAGYLLTRLALLRGDVPPQDLDVDDVVTWVRRNELSWAPGCADLEVDVPWGALRALSTDAELVEYCLRHATAELNAVPLAEARSDPRLFAARRLLPRSTLVAYGYVPPASDEAHLACADGHVHQGAALPFEVTLHWVANGIASLPQTPGAPDLRDTDRTPFRALPLLAVMRALLDGGNVDWARVLGLVGEAAGDHKSAAEAADRLSAELGLVVGERDLDSLAAIEKRKSDALYTWAPGRRVALLRIEAILHSAVTQRQSGLDIFVDLFERYAALRRSTVAKEEYFRRAIAEQVEQSKFHLRRLELRLGELITRPETHQADLEAEFRKALSGYREHVVKHDEPVLVTFPLGLIKSPPGKTLAADHWRFNPKGIYELVETLIDVLDQHPALAPFVDGIDVCGLEESEPNWLFAPAFARFAEATVNLNPRPACRFHAGEWQWTPLHGLRRIAEFLRFDLPPGTPRRVGHGLALKARDWSRFSHQPLDELLDDLLWVRGRLDAFDDMAPTVRLVERLILDLRQRAHESEVIHGASVDMLVAAYGARFDTKALEQISFLSSTQGRLTFQDYPVGTVGQEVLQILAATLRLRQNPMPTVAEALGRPHDIPGLAIDQVQQVLVDLYELLAPEVLDDVRWGSVIVEACPTSNVLAGGVRGHGDHPMRAFVEAGVLATVNTDDPALFHSWLPEEVAHAASAMRVPPRQVARSRELSLRTVAPGLVQSRLLNDLDAALRSLGVAKVSV